MNSEELAERLLEQIVENGGAILNSEGKVLAGPSERYSTRTVPTQAERVARTRLLRLAKEALALGKEEHALDLKALATLEAFCHGKTDYHELVGVRRAMGVRANAAGAVGLRHDCPNAAATLTCFHACHPDIKKAEELTEYFYKRTQELAAKANDERKK